MGTCFSSTSYKKRDGSSRPYFLVDVLLHRVYSCSWAKVLSDESGNSSIIGTTQVPVIPGLNLKTWVFDLDKMLNLF